MKATGCFWSKIRVELLKEVVPGNTGQALTLRGDIAIINHFASPPLVPPLRRPASAHGIVSIQSTTELI